MLSICKVFLFAFLHGLIQYRLIVFIMRALIIKHCSPSLTIVNTIKSNLDMHLHGIYIQIILQFIKPIVSHLNAI